MKKFFFNLLSSFVGAWIALVLFVVALVIVGVGMLGKVGSKSTAKITDKSVLVLNLEGEISETEPDVSALEVLQLINEGKDTRQTLQTIVNALEEGADNKSIKGLYIKCNGAEASPATLNVIRTALEKFKESKKPVYAYGDALTQGDYYVACAADSMFMNPQGMINLHGVYGITPYMKGLFDKFGITFDVFRVGTYKSAVEPYTMTEMSTPARAQLDTLYNEIWTTIKGGIAKSRKISASLPDTLINRDNITFCSGEFVKKSKLVDALCYERTMDERIAAAIGVDKKELNFVSASTLEAMWNAKKIGSVKNSIAVLYAVGAINDHADEGINFETIVPIINELAEDENVKGLVLRVNSPGGSAFGSEQIWEALEGFKKSGKPYAVSMGDYAASGGYYISCGAQRIFADPLTLTGSIGIFGLFPQLQGLVSGKLGVNMELVATNPSAVFPNPYKPMTDVQREAMQEYINRGYELFVNRCAQGRKMPVEKIKTVAQGRVWSGLHAKQIGLVDELGTLDDAIAWVKKEAGLKDFARINYPENSNTMQALMRQLNSVKAATLLTGNSEVYDFAAPFAPYLLNILHRSPIQARMVDLQIKM